ncbi:MAG: cryptochrome/photolyase family protein [bacterium]
MVLFWFRRDLRLQDNTALYHALSENNEVQPIFIFDNEILGKLEEKRDSRVTFIHKRLELLNLELKKHEASLWTFHGKPIEIFKQLIKKIPVKAIYLNKDYEPYAIERDKEIIDLAFHHKISLKNYKDHVIFEENDILKKDGRPYTIYTPYMRMWKKSVSETDLPHYFSENLLKNLNNFPFSKIINLDKLGFLPGFHQIPGEIPGYETIKEYDKYRDFPAIEGTTRIGPHLRFGTISIRQMARLGMEYNSGWINELIWREFFQSIIYHFPYSAQESFKKKYDSIQWINDEKQFESWCKGKTGYPFVDAGMKQLNNTGFMHNRVRMIVASFLTKHLLIDWRWGEAYFAKKLLDYELASNVGNWQWAASCGCDAVPYFRIFNPNLQMKKYDPELKYIKKWVPAVLTPEYEKPIIDHEFARKRAILSYKKAQQDYKS